MTTESDAAHNDQLTFRGRSWKFGDNVPTDAIVPSHLVLRPMAEIVPNVLASLNPDFPVKCAPGDIVVAGHHFGQSSGRTIASQALKETAVGCVVAESFARTYLRNCFEIGLPILECPGISALVGDGDEVAVDIPAGIVTNVSTGRTIQAPPPDRYLLEMLRCGGLLEFVERRPEEWTG